MTNRVLLNNVDHHDVAVAIRHEPAFGDSANQILVLPTELAQAQREFPILLRADGNGGYTPVVLLGLDRDENLFLGAHGWNARHVPLVQRRGPFSIALKPGSGGEPEVMIEIDLDDPRMSRDAGAGQPLFLPHGGNSPYLEHVGDVLRAIYAGHQLLAPMAAAFDAAGLIQPVQLEARVSEEQRYTVPDAFTIDRERLAALDGNALAALNRSGFLQAAFFIAASLDNLATLIALKQRKSLGG